MKTTLLLLSALVAAAPAFSATPARFDDSVVDADALQMPRRAAFGNAINGVSFRQEALVTYGRYQYTVWYTRAEERLMLARREVDAAKPGSWQSIALPWRLENGGPPGPRVGYSPWNAHNVASIGVCPRDGTLHLVWDCHGGALRYTRSIPGLLDKRVDEWAASAFEAERAWLAQPEKRINSVTYPYFVSTPDGDLQLVYRRGTSGWGDVMMIDYRATAAGGQWGEPRCIIAKEGDYEDVVGKSAKRNAYFNGVHYGPDGRVHITWCWREQPGKAGNHDIAYACSPDGGIVWQNGAGEKLVQQPGVSGPVSIASPGITFAKLDRTWSVHNQQSQAVDSSGRVHVLMWHRRDDAPAADNSGGWQPELSAHFHYVRDPKTGSWARHQLPGGIWGKGSLAPRPKIGTDSRDVAYALFAAPAGLSKDALPGAFAIARATPEAGYADWRIVHVGSFVIDGEPLFDPKRLSQSGVLSVLVQEAVPVGDAPSGARLHVLEFPVSQWADNPGEKTK